MKLITEHNFNVKPILEDKKDGQKDLYIEGIFMQAEQVNRNGRIYPVGVLDKEVGRYVKEYVKTNRALGELNHPDTPAVDPAKASHKIVALEKHGNDYIGKAKILKTPMGEVVRGLLESDVQLGVSSRGMGSIKERDGVNEVQSDFVLSTVDIVHDPSAPSAFVNGIMEGVDWVMENGVLKAHRLEDYRRDIEKTSRANKEAAMLEAFEDFINHIKKG